MEQTAKPNRNFLRAIIGFALYLLLTPLVLFIAAGTVRWPMAWAYTILLFVSTIGSRLIALKRYPDLLHERADFTRAEGAKSWDRILVQLIGLYAPVVMMVIAGLDHRFGWPPKISQLEQWIAFIIIAGAYGLSVWAMSVNRFFSAVARIQKERGQVVITSGPYGMIRHPSYSGALIASLALPFMLDAIWTLVPAFVYCVLLIVRTALEDRMLLDELSGYSDYAKRTRFRLFPGVW